jgi:hypothetical protein
MHENFFYKRREGWGRMCNNGKGDGAENTQNPKDAGSVWKVPEVFVDDGNKILIQVHSETSKGYDITATRGIDFSGPIAGECLP